jgi:hypothetical protein
MAPWSLFSRRWVYFLWQRGGWRKKQLLYPLAWFAAVFVVLSLALGKQPSTSCRSTRRGAALRRVVEAVVRRGVRGDRLGEAAAYAIAAVFVS